MKEQSGGSSPFVRAAAAENSLQPHSISCTHGVVTLICQINTMDNKYKGKMIAVVYLEKVVCEAHDINSAFSVRKFTSKLPPEQSTRKRRGGKTEACMNAGHQTKWEPENHCEASELL